MRDILFLSHRLPYPPDRGDRIRSWHVLNALARLARVHVVAPCDTAADAQYVPIVENVAAAVTSVVRHSGKLRPMLRALASGRPASVEAFIDPRLERAVDSLLAGHDIGCIYAFSSQMAHYVPRTFAGKFVMDFVDMDSAKFAAGNAVERAEGRRLLAWEKQVAARADAALFISEAEATLFRAATGFPTQVVENGIDVARFGPGVEPVTAPHPLIVFTGQMDYAPNVAAVIRMVRDVLPELPGATFAIVGRAPTRAVRALAGEQVIVTGEVPDTRPWLAAADVVVAPLTLARGVQNKVLEAMAMARPVVLSPQAAAGIDAVDGRDFVVAANPAPVLRELLADPERCAVIGQAARARMVARYGWDAQLAPLAAIVGA